MVKSHQNNNLVSPFPRKSGSSLAVIGLIATISISFLGMVLLISLFQRVPVDKLTGDVTAIAEIPIYSGLLTQIGIFFWIAAAAICLFSATIILPKNHLNSLKIRRFLLISAIITLFLGLDDAFLFHEAVFPSLGISENIVYLSYAGFFLFYLGKFWSIICKTDYRIMVLALIFFSISILLDIVHLLSPIAFLFEEPIFSFLEDAAKFTGIVSWFTYFFHVGQWSIKHSVAKLNADVV
ncbi:MAG: hypothetical protein AAF821_20570 [Cyanobacteria bacterium P01_D01_bin.156]